MLVFVSRWGDWRHVGFDLVLEDSVSSSGKSDVMVLHAWSLLGVNNRAVCDFPRSFLLMSDRVAVGVSWASVQRDTVL